MKSFQASATIAASPEMVWKVLADAAAWPSWDSGVERIEGEVTPGATIKVYSMANPGRAFPVTVDTVDAPRRMIWRSGMPLGLFKGVRTFTLTPRTDGTTSFDMREEFTGPLSPLIGRSIPDLQPSFDTFATGLKKQAEGAA